MALPPATLTRPRVEPQRGPLFLVQAGSLLDPQLDRIERCPGVNHPAHVPLRFRKAHSLPFPCWSYVPGCKELARQSPQRKGVVLFCRSLGLKTNGEDTSREQRHRKRERPQAPVEGRRQRGGAELAHLAAAEPLLPLHGGGGAAQLADGRGEPALRHAERE